MLQEDFLHDFTLTVAGLSDAVGVSRQSINELLRGRRAVSPAMALRLARLLGSSQVA
jgi:addiction module HigA family antidote